MEPSKRKLDPAREAKLEAEALKYRDLDHEMGLEFEALQEEAYVLWSATWEQEPEGIDEPNGVFPTELPPRALVRPPLSAGGIGLPASREPTVAVTPSVRTPRYGRFREHPIQSTTAALSLLLLLASSAWAYFTPQGAHLWWRILGSGKTMKIKEQAGDFMLLLDRSGSIDQSKLINLQKAAKGFVTFRTPSASGSHIGVVSFSTFATLDQPLTDDAAALRAAINALITGGVTNLEEAILTASTELAGIKGRPGSFPQVMVIITDGDRNFCDETSCDPIAAATAAATAAKKAGIIIYVVAIGATLQQGAFLKDNIATDASHYTEIDNFAGLDTTLRRIATQTSKQFM